MTTLIGTSAGSSQACDFCMTGSSWQLLAMIQGVAETEGVTGLLRRWASKKAIMRCWNNGTSCGKCG